MKVPKSLLENLADSELEVISWDGDQDVLRVWIIKDIGQETGILSFIGVVLVCLPSKLTIAGITIADKKALPPICDEQLIERLAAQEQVIVIHGAWGETAYVVAEQLQYEISSANK